MLEQLERNLYEDHGFERVVDLGHTFSPTLESASRHGLLHGEAVAIDIALSCVLANERGTMTEAETDRVLALLQRMGLHVWNDLLTRHACRSALEEAARHRGGRTNLVLPRGIGTSGTTSSTSTTGAIGT
jgi:3-dehydroquinate synthase